MSRKNIKITWGKILYQCRVADSILIWQELPKESFPKRKIRKLSEVSIGVLVQFDGYGSKMHCSLLVVKSLILNKTVPKSSRMLRKYCLLVYINSRRRKSSARIFRVSVIKSDRRLSFRFKFYNLKFSLKT